MNTLKKKQNDETEKYNLDSQDQLHMALDCNEVIHLFVADFDEACKTGDIDEKHWKMRFRMMHVYIRSVSKDVLTDSHCFQVLFGMILLFSSKRDEFIEILKNQ